MRAAERRSTAVRAKRGLFAAVFLVTLHSLDFSFGWTPILDGREITVKEGDYTVEVWKTLNDDCPLDVTGTYPYLVKVCDKNTGWVIRQGVILSHQAVLTTGFDGLIENYLVVSQRVFASRGFNHKICFQTRKVIGVTRHPKYTEGYTGYAMDFQILTLERQFDASPNFVYPTIPLHKSPYEYIQFIRRVDVIRGLVGGCELPHLGPQDSTIPVLSPLDYVQIWNYGTPDCTRSICSGTDDLRRCREFFVTSRKYTAVCAELEDGEQTFVAADWRFGSPLICNGSTVGLAVAAIVTDRQLQRTVVIVSTFVRIWPWLMTYKDIFWNSSFGRKGWDSEFIEDHRLYFNAINKRNQNKNVTLEGSRIKFMGSWLKRLVSRSAGWRINYSFMIYSTGVLMTFLMF